MRSASPMPIAGPVRRLRGGFGMPRVDAAQEQAWNDQQLAVPVSRRARLWRYRPAVVLGRSQRARYRRWIAGGTASSSARPAAARYWSDPGCSALRWSCRRNTACYRRALSPTVIAGWASCSLRRWRGTAWRPPRCRAGSQKGAGRSRLGLFRRHVAVGSCGRRPQVGGLRAAPRPPRRPAGGRSAALGRALGDVVRGDANARRAGARAGIGHDRRVATDRTAPGGRGTCRQCRKPARQAAQGRQRASLPDCERPVVRLACGRRAQQREDIMSSNDEFSRWILRCRKPNCICISKARWSRN